MWRAYRAILRVYWPRGLPAVLMCLGLRRADAAQRLDGKHLEQQHARPSSLDLMPLPRACPPLPEQSQEALCYPLRRVRRVSRRQEEAASCPATADHGDPAGDGVAVVAAQGSCREQRRRRSTSSSPSASREAVCRAKGRGCTGREVSSIWGRKSCSRLGSSAKLAERERSHPGAQSRVSVSYLVGTKAAASR